VDDRKGKHQQAPASAAESGGADRRRLSRIVHDERGNASVEWLDRPDVSERTPLSVEDAEAASRPGKGYNPYDRPPGARSQQDPQRDERPPRRDLRKLSEWIKQMRELEQRKQRGDDEQ
jgi:hypothetical protein